MDDKKVLENLCVYDKRNPDCLPDDCIEGHDFTKDCYCDNCFYGRTELANNLLDSISMLKKINTVFGAMLTVFGKTFSIGTFEELDRTIKESKKLVVKLQEE